MTTETKTAPATGDQKTDNDSTQTEQKQPDPKTTETTPDAKALQEELAKANARIKELNTENEKRRKLNKELQEADARKQKALDILAGKEGTETDPVALEKKATEEKFRRLALRSAFVDVAAKEMHDASFAFGALEREFKDVKVDIETGEVDKEAVTAKVAELKTSKPFLFVTHTQQNSTPAPRGSPDGGGLPKGTSALVKWNQLRADPLRQGEAQKFYSENKVAILSEMK